jgi:hypothetical protein
MMRPPDATYCAACAMTRKVPRRFVWITLSKVATSPLPIGDSGMMPELFTTTSTLPNALSTSANKVSTSASLPTSAFIAIARPPID